VYNVGNLGHELLEVLTSAELQGSIQVVHEKFFICRKSYVLFSKKATLSQRMHSVFLVCFSLQVFVWDLEIMNYNFLNFE
jgi:hypothetical protein